MIYKSVLNEGRWNRLLSTRVRDLRPYLRKIAGLSQVPRQKYATELPPGFDQEAIHNIVYTLRGRNYRPAIFVHGVLPRAGTNYLADLFKLHSDIYAHPHRFWEFPLLSITDHAIQFQNDFARVFKKNAEVLSTLELPVVFASGLMKNLQDQVGDKTMLFKFPYVYYIHLFRAFFPDDYLILLLRDGRDVVASSTKSFKKGLFPQRFADYCREWSLAARAILRYEADSFDAHPRTFVVKYEDILKAPEIKMRGLMVALSLSVDNYEVGMVNELPVRGSSELAHDGKSIHWDPTPKEPSFNPVGRWGAWSQRQRRTFKAYAGAELIRAGYEGSNDW